MSNLQSIWDDFNTPWSVINLVDYDSRWVTASSEKIGLTIIGNELVDNPDWLSALHIFFYRDDCVMPDDQFSQATIGGSDAANPNLGPGIRCAAGTNHGYVVRFVTAALYIYRVDTSSSVTTIGSVSTTVASLDVIRIEASGTSISAYKNEVLVLGPITSSTYTSGYSGICARTSTHTWKLDDWSAGAVIGATSADGTATQTIFPDSIAASTNMTGAVTAIDESVDSPDANWLTATSATAATACRVTFPTPSLSPTGDQHFRLWLRKTTGAANPLLSAYLYQAGVSRTLMIHHTPVSSTTGEQIQLDWNSSALIGTTDGSDVECYLSSIVGTTPGATPVFSSIGTPSSANNITSTLTPTKPATVNAGDLLLLIWMGHHDEGDGEAGTVSGWTKFTVPSGASHVVVRTLFWRIAGAGEGGQTVSVTGTGGTTNDLAMAVIARFTATDGFDPVNPIETTPLLISGTASPLATDGFHTKFINRLAVCVGTIGSSDASIGNMTGETGGDWIDRATVNTTTGSDGTINIQTSDQSNGAAIVGGSIAFTPTVSSVWLSDTFCLVPKTISVNTIEIGAIEWDQWYISPTVTTELQADGVVSTTISVTVGADAKVFMVGTILTDQEPEIPVVSDTTPTTVGTQFYSDKFGRVKYIRWYNGRSLGVRTHKVGLYTQDGSILAETEITAEIGPGWQITELPLEVEIDPEYKYVAAVHWPEGNYPKTDAALTLQIDNDVMHAYAQGGRTAAGADLTFPEVLE